MHMGVNFSSVVPVTPRSAMEFCRSSNSSNLLLLFSLPARMKKIQSKMNELECFNKIFPIISQWEFFQRLKGS